MSFLYPVTNDDDAPELERQALAQGRWPLRNTLWLVLAFCSFAWVTVIFACIEFL